MPPAQPVIETPEVRVKSKFSLDHNKIALILGGIVILAIAGIIALMLLLNKPNPQNNSNTQLQNSTNNNLPGPNALINLPSNICPESIHNDTNGLIADYQGKPYLVDTNADTWIQQNCSGKTTGLNTQNSVPTNSNSSDSQALNEPEPPLLLKSIGFNLEDYDSATQTAGDIKFTTVPLPFDEIFGPFGQQDPRSPNDPTKTNPQPTVILPLGTDVHSLVDGVVVEVKSLYSGDNTIWVAKSKNSSWFYETEHVMNPLVAIGDTVKAGQVIGKVSDYDSHNNPGFGLVEIGILHPTPNGAPEHVCPYNYLDPSIKSSVNSKLTKLYAAWESYLGKEVYNQETFATPGCVTLNHANG